MVALVFAAAFLAQVALYALWRNYVAASERVQQRADGVFLRTRGSAGRFIGGSSHVGEN